MKKTCASLAALLLLVAPAWAGAQMEGPDQVEIDTMAELYEPVSFDHTAHVDLTEGNCAVCHHHATGQKPVVVRCLSCHKGGEPADRVACSECHPVNRYDANYLREVAADPYRHHVDLVGLKGAYHRLCLGCHREEGAPTGCQDCHTRTDAGDRRFNAGPYAPKGRPAGGHGGHH